MSRANFDPRDRADTRMTPDALVGGKWTFKRLDAAGTRIRLMARSGGYVMVRKPHCLPFILSEKEWAELDLFEVKA